MKGVFEGYLQRSFLRIADIWGTVKVIEKGFFEKFKYLRNFINETPELE